MFLKSFSSGMAKSINGLVTALGVFAAANSPAMAQESFPTFLDPNDTVFLMIDHQTGLLQAVGDTTQRDLRANVTALAEAAAYFDIPVIATSSVPTGPNGPLLPEIAAAAPDATVIPRAGEINAWDSEAFRAAVEATGRRTVVISGILTRVCVAFPALSMLDEGYNVYAAIDASGDVSEMSALVTTERLAAAGVEVTTTFAVLSELHVQWDAENAPTMAGIYSRVSPGYATVLESFYAERQ